MSKPNETAEQLVEKYIATWSARMGLPLGTPDKDVRLADYAESVKLLDELARRAEAAGLDPAPLSEFRVWEALRARREAGMADCSPWAGSPGNDNADYWDAVRAIRANRQAGPTDLVGWVGSEDDAKADSRVDYLTESEKLEWVKAAQRVLNLLDSIKGMVGEGGFRPVSAFVGMPEFPHASSLTKYLDRHTNIRQRQVSKQRREVHALDLIDAVLADRKADERCGRRVSALANEADRQKDRLRRNRRY